MDYCLFVDLLAFLGLITFVCGYLLFELDLVNLLYFVVVLAFKFLDSDCRFKF